MDCTDLSTWGHEPSISQVSISRAVFCFARRHAFSSTSSLSLSENNVTECRSAPILDDAILNDTPDRPEKTEDRCSATPGVHPAPAEENRKPRTTPGRRSSHACTPCSALSASRSRIYAQTDVEWTLRRDRIGWSLFLPPGKCNRPFKRKSRRAGNVEHNSLIGVMPPWRVIFNQLVGSKLTLLDRLHFHGPLSGLISSVCLPA